MYHVICSASPQRWYVNGNIKCFSGGHIALGLLAILVLGLCVTLIPLSFTYIMGWLRVRVLLLARST